MNEWEDGMDDSVNCDRVWNELKELKEGIE